MLARPQDLLGQVHLELVVEPLDLVLKPLLEVDHLSWKLPPRPRRTSGDTITAPRADAPRRDAPKPREPAVRRLRALKERAGERDLCLLEGPRLVLEALAAGLAVVEAAASPRAEASPAGPAALAELRQREVPVRRMAAELVAASLSEAETSQGLLALARRPSIDEEEVFHRTPPLVLVADGVQDPGNLGGLLRTAEAAGAQGVLTKGCADPFSWKALRGSMGSAFRLPHVRGGSIEQVLDALDERGIAVLATAADGERRYDDARPARAGGPRRGRRGRRPRPRRAPARRRPAAGSPSRSRSRA